MVQRSTRFDTCAPNLATYIHLDLLQMICDNRRMDDVARLLKEKGLRLTSQKKQVICTLNQTPQTVLQILSLLKSKKISIDKATIYRILTSFVGLGLVKEIQFGDRETRYELIGDEHHHHLICEECGGIEDVELSEKALLKEVSNQSKFQIKRHSLEFFGTCKKCQ